MDAVTATSMSPAQVHVVVDHVVAAPARRSVRFEDGEEPFAAITGFAAKQDEDNGGDDDEGDKDSKSDNSGDAGGEDDRSGHMRQEEGETSDVPRQVRFFDDQCDETPVEPPPSSLYSRATSIAASPQSARSPLLKKFSPLQDRRVNAVLIEALQLVEFSSAELAVIDKAAKRLRDAVHGFALLVDKQVNIIGAESLEERGRVRADIMDLCSSLKTSNALLEGTSARMKKALGAGKNQIHAHKRKLLGRAVQDIVDASSPSKAPSNSDRPSARRASAGSPQSTRVPSSPYALSLDAPVSPIAIATGKKSPIKPPPLFSTSRSPTRVPFASLLRVEGGDLDTDGSCEDSDEPLLPPDAFSSVLESVGLAENEFLDLRGVTRVLHEALAVLVARSTSLTFLGKAHHRKLLPQYASELARLVLVDLHALPQATPASPVVVPSSTLFDYMSATPSRFDALMQILRVSNTSGGSRDGVSRPSPSPSPSSRKGSPSRFFRPAAFMSSASKAAAESFGVNPFAAQLTRNGGLVNGGEVVSLVVGSPADPELLESAEQTLNMAKLLHELATAECEARAGDRISLRAPDARAKEFSRAYLAASKQLLEKEAAGGFC